MNGNDDNNNSSSDNSDSSGGTDKPLKPVCPLHRSRKMIKGSLEPAKATAIRLRLHHLYPPHVKCLLRALHHIEKIKKSGINSLIDLAEAGTFQTILVMSMAKHDCHQIYNMTFNVWDIGKRRLDKNQIAAGHVQADLSKSNWWQD
jgi:hypothetical protein